MNRFKDDGPGPDNEGNAGFTLIEVVMVIVIMGIIGATVGSLLFEGTKSFGIQKAARELTADGTLAMERMTRELRRIRCATAGNTCTAQATDITAMTPTEIRFETFESTGMGFNFNAGNLLLRQGSGGADPEDVLTDGVTSMSFVYTKKDGTTAAAANEVWLITINLTLTSGAESMDFRTKVHPRSFR